MTDTPGTLEERLRAEIERKRDAGGDMLYRGAPDPLLTEAADEIASLRARVEELETAGRYIKPYLVWTVGPESPGYHPTMPSAVGAFLDAVAPKGRVRARPATRPHGAPDPKRGCQLDRP